MAAHETLKLSAPATAGAATTSPNSAPRVERSDAPTASPSPTGTESPAALTVTPDKIAVQVLNGSGVRGLATQAVEALQSKIREQEELIRQLTQKADESVQQVQTIAVKAIEGASAQRIVTERVKEA